MHVLKKEEEEEAEKTQSRPFHLTIPALTNFTNNRERRFLSKGLEAGRGSGLEEG